MSVETKRKERIRVYANITVRHNQDDSWGYVIVAVSLQKQNYHPVFLCINVGAGEDAFFPFTLLCLAANLEVLMFAMDGTSVRAH